MGFKILVFLLIAVFVQGLTAKVVSANNQDRDLEEQLKYINKPAVRSFQTKYGDILDCVEIRKQLAFDHPLLRHHSIQMKPTEGFSKPVKSTLKLTDDHVRCPKGTVLVRRVQKQDLLHMKNRKFLGTFTRTSNSQKSVYSKAVQSLVRNEVATLLIQAKNTGIGGYINLWGPEVGANYQFSSASIFAQSEDLTLKQNIIATGWTANTDVFPNSLSRLFIYWTTDNGKTTGCFNTLCPGFVQVSKEIYPGATVQPVSVYGGNQYEIRVSIRQDPKTKNWWVSFGDKEIGYYPAEIFTRFNGSIADSAGWGGDTGGPSNQPLPAMGSGHFPEEGYSKAAYITRMTLFDASGKEFYPDASSLQKFESNEKCYKALFVGDDEKVGRYMFFGGPPNCKLN